MSIPKINIMRDNHLEESKIEYEKSSNIQKSHLSFSQYYSQSKVLPASQISGEYKSNCLKREMQELVNYFSQFKSSRIHTPCDKKCFLLSINSNIFHFGEKNKILLCGAMTLKDKKIPISFQGTGLKCAEYIGNNQIIFTNKESQMLLYSLDAKYNPVVSTIADLNISFLREIRSNGNEITAIKTSQSQDHFFTLENRGSKGLLYQWINFEPTELFSVNYKGQCMDISEDSVYIVTGHEDSTLILYTKNQNNVREFKNGKISKISCVKISKNSNIVAYGGNCAWIFIEKLDNMGNPYEICSHSLKIKCLAITDDERVLISGGNDGKIYVWDLMGNIDGFALADLKILNKDDQVAVTSLLLDKSGVVNAYSSDGVINSLKIPNLNQYYILNIKEKLQKVDIMFGAVSKEGELDRAMNSVFTFSNSNLFSIDINTSDLYCCKTFDTKNICAVAVEVEAEVVCIVFSQDEAQNEGKFYSAQFYNYRNLNLLGTINFEINDLKKICFSYTNNYLVPYGGHQYKLIQIYNGSHQSIVVHKERITALTNSLNQNVIYSGDSSGLILVNRLLADGSLFQEKALLQNNTKVLNLWVEPSEVYLVAYHEDKETTVWEIKKGLKINSIEKPDLIDIIFPKQTSLMFCLNTSSISAYHLPSLISYFSITLKTQPEKFCFVQNEENIAVYMSNSIYIFRNPVQTTEILPFGDLNNISLFYDKIIKLIGGRLKTHDSFLNNWFISPFGANIMHLYSYLDYPLHMEEAFKQKVGFFPCKSGGTPLDIALDLVYEDCLDLILERFQEFNPIQLWVLESSLIRLNLCPYFQVFKFYDFFMLKSIDTTLPKFYNSKRELPISVISSQLLAENEKFMPKEEFSLEGTELLFKQTFMKINMVPGSRDSILLARSIGETTNGDIFNSEFFKLLLDEKWKKVKLILYCQALLYLSYLGTISAYGVTRIHWIFILSFAINLVLILYECIELFTSPIDYFRDKYNWCDLTRSFLSCYYFGKVYLGYSLNREEITILVIITWFKAVSYFRLVESTRYFINLLFYIVADSVPFLAFLLTVTFAMSILYTILLDTGEGYYHFLKITWELNLGNFDTGDYGFFMYAVFFCHTIINPIILLNLLISIMGDTYEKVNSQLAWANGKELITMIIEGENIMFWNRNYNYKEYMHYCVRKLRGASSDQGMKKLRVKVQQIHMQNDKILVAVDEGMKTLNQRLDSLFEMISTKK